MKRFIAYAFIATISFTIFLIVLAPAQPLFSLVKNDIYQQIPDFSITGTEGTIWSGQSTFQLRKFPSSNLTWQLEALPIIEQQFVLSLALSGDFHQLKSDLSLEEEMASVENFNGEIGSDFINAVSEEFGLTFSGDIDITDVNLQFSQEGLYLANGRINWAGGEIISRTMRDGTQIYRLPPLQGDFSVNIENKGLQLNIHQQSGSERNQPNIIQINLKPNGWVVVAIKSGIFPMAGLSWQGELNDTAFEYEEKLF